MKFLKDKISLIKYGALALAVMMLFASILFFVIWPDNLMHSDMAAEVLLSKLLAEEGGLMSANWFYSTELRVVYTQLVMTPLFLFISDYGIVKLLSVIILDVFLAVVFYFTAKEFGLKNASLYLAMALLLTPLSNEYFDMMLIGNFYTCQAICTFLVLKFFFKFMKEKTAEKNDAKVKRWIGLALLAVVALILGLSGLRYLASLYLPLVAAFCFSYVFDDKEERMGKLFSVLLTSIGLLGFAGIGFLINKYYLATIYTFDSQAVQFVPLSEVPERFLTSIKLMLEFCGYREVGVVTPLGVVNAVKFAFFIFVIYVVIDLMKHRYQILDNKQRMFLYYFLALFLINWYMLVFTDVLPQYRYWLPIYIIAVILIGIWFCQAKPKSEFLKPVLAILAVATVFASLYGELWQAAKYNDCEKRYGYMEFLEEHDYTFGYATFWNSSVTEYLSDGKIEVGHLGGNEQGSAPYAWLSPKYYYQEGYHEGKTFLLLAVTEEPALFNGDINVMQDFVKVYQDEFYVIYEGEGMHLFSEGD
ncbi:MAG: hypothetical protein J6K37_05070 [Lachnospiraceae bacterium]|nr:hypothetical protein [Lachnospiraceae bacterium]